MPEETTLEPARSEPPDDQTVTASTATALAEPPTTVFDVDRLSVFYGAYRALHGVDMALYDQQITALIGPSGCGKTTFLRCLNRMNDLVVGARVEGRIHYRGEDIRGPRVRPIELRRRIGMVFQKPNPFPKSVYENVAFAPRTNGARRGDLDDIVESALRSAALWDEVRGKLKESAFSLSGGQQQRLCIARALAVQPDVILMDEPCAALDPIATRRIEDLMRELRSRFAIVIVTHNLQQAARVSDRTAFFTAEPGLGGQLVEIDLTERVFGNPTDPRTADYVAGRVG